MAVFSGTGNARRAAGIVAEELEASGRAVETVDLATGADIPALGEGDMLVLCSSTLGFSPPSTVMERLKAAPRSDGAEAAMLCACGGVMMRGKIAAGWSGAASVTALNTLRRKGWVPVGSADASYPENWTQMTEVAKGDDQTAIIARGDADSRAFGKALATGTRTFLKRNLLTLTVGRFVGFIFRLFARKILGSMYIADDTCTSCGLCERVCPARAIVMEDGRPRWTPKCSDCNRCINVCPSASIQTSTARLVIFTAVNVAAMVFSPALARSLLHVMAPGFGGAGFGLASFLLGVAVYAAVTALQLGPLDTVVRRMERAPGLRRFFTASFTRRYQRYLAPGFKPTPRNR
jgi:NAD-dependent dihydropyrimidine dehydrogenase PreA subunit